MNAANVRKKEKRMDKTKADRKKTGRHFKKA